MSDRGMAFVFCIMALGCIIPVQAAQFTTVQGGIIRAMAHPVPPGIRVRAEAFGKTWPTERQAGERLLAWIGVDMETLPGKYVLRWQSNPPAAWSHQDTLLVKDAHFRVSRIHVAKSMAEFGAKALARIRADQAAFRRAYRTPVPAHPVIAFPALPVKGIISTPFGARRLVNGEPRAPHSGIDIAANEGTPVLAPLAGKVLLAKAMFLNGNAIAIGHGLGLVSVYTHLESLDVHPGQWVDTGEYIGKVGRTGRATGPHLHWGVRFRGARVNPLALIAGHGQEQKP